MTQTAEVNIEGARALERNRVETTGYTDKQIDKLIETCKQKQELIGSQIDEIIKRGKTNKREKLCLCDIIPAAIAFVSYQVYNTNPKDCLPTHRLTLAALANFFYKRLITLIEKHYDCIITPQEQVFINKIKKQSKQELDSIIESMRQNQNLKNSNEIDNIKTKIKDLRNYVSEVDICIKSQVQ